MLPPVGLVGNYATHSVHDEELTRIGTITWAVLFNQFRQIIHTKTLLLREYNNNYVSNTSYLVNVTILRDTRLQLLPKQTTKAPLSPTTI